ncbi:OmpA family protein [Kaarinaea lacus]
MATKKLRTVENLILLTFPIVLFAGCAGSDVKPVTEEQNQAVLTETSTQEYDISLPARETPELSVVEIQSNPDESEILGNNNEATGNVSTPDSVDSSIALQKSIDTAPSTIPEAKIFYFDTNVHTLTDDQRKQLQGHADYLITNPGAVLVINGHADERGTEAYNQALSEKRAMETFKLLITLGVPEDQLVTKGFGELVPMHAENNWDENRRIELEYTDPMMLSSM